jgi:uncharacterized protein involved in exopolysaccharide biosynthesis
LVAAAATYAALDSVRPLYRADTTILIEERESPLTRPRDDMGGASADFDESAIQSQVEVLRSRQIAEVVIDRLDLVRRPEFDPKTGPSPIDRLRVLLGREPRRVAGSPAQRVMQKYYERLSVYPLEKSRVIGVEVEAPDPALAAEIANAIAEAFVDLQQEDKRGSAMAATAWLEQEIERLRDRVAEAEQAVADYRTGADLYSSDGVGNLSTQQLGDLNAELARARAARLEAEARANLVQSLLAEGGSLEASPEVLDSALIQRLRERQVALQAEIADLSTTFLPGHPRIQALRGQLANLEPQIRQEARRVLASLNTAARVAAAREESLMDSLDLAKSAVALSNEQEIQLRALEREAAAQRDLLESFLARYREALARTDANYLPADARIISRAVAPLEPSYPKKAMMALAAGLAALLITAALLLLREFTSGRAFRIVDYGLPAQAAPLAITDQVVVRSAESTPRRHVETVVTARQSLDPVSSRSGIARRAREVLEHERAAAGLAATLTAMGKTEPPGAVELAAVIASPAVRVALFAGADGGEGAGDVAHAAARAAARENHKLVLVDLGGTPSEALGGRDLPGLGDLLSGDAAFGEVIRRDEATRVHTIPLGRMAPSLPLQRLQLVIGALTRTYDKVIVVADAFRDWPDEQVKPDVAAIVCGPEAVEASRSRLYNDALAGGGDARVAACYGGGSAVAGGEGEGRGGRGGPGMAGRWEERRGGKDKPGRWR